MASDHSHSPLLTQNHSEKSNKWNTCSHKIARLVKPKKSHVHLQFIVSELQNFPFKVASSISMIVFAISVWDIVRPLLLAARVIAVYLQSNLKKAFLSGLKRKLFSLDGVRTALFCQIMDTNTKGKIAHLSYFRWAFFTHQRFSNGKDWSRVRSSFCWVWSQRSISVARTYPGIFGKFELIFWDRKSVV